MVSGNVSNETSDKTTNESAWDIVTKVNQQVFRNTVTGVFLKLPGQVVGPYNRSPAEDGRALDGVPKLSNIPRPAIVHKKLLRSRIETERPVRERLEETAC